MDTITLIPTALAAGATLIAKGTADEAIKDAYKSLKALIQCRFAGKLKAEMVLSEYESKPNVWEAPLREVLTETAADKDKEIIKAAQKFMTLINLQQATMDKCNMQIIGKAQGSVQEEDDAIATTSGKRSKRGRTVKEPPKKGRLKRSEVIKVIEEVVRRREAREAKQT